MTESKSHYDNRCGSSMHNYGFGLECDVGYIRFIHSVTRSTTPWKLFEMLLLSAFVLLSGFVRNLTLH